MPREDLLAEPEHLLFQPFEERAGAEPASKGWGGGGAGNADVYGGEMYPKQTVQGHRLRFSGGDSDFGASEVP